MHNNKVIKSGEGACKWRCYAFYYVKVSSKSGPDQKKLIDQGSKNNGVDYVEIVLFR